MTFDDIKKYFGSVAKASEALKLNPITVWKWLYRDSIPYSRQLELEKISDGALRATRDTFFLPSFRYFDEFLGMCRVHSITFSGRKSPLILYGLTRKQTDRKYSSNLNNLMQATSFVDSIGLNLFERDIIFVDKKIIQLGDLHDIYVFHDEYDLTFSGFKIIGNIFEGKLYGHQED